MVCFAGNTHFSGECYQIALAFSEVSTEKVGTFVAGSTTTYQTVFEKTVSCVSFHVEVHIDVS